MFACMNNLPAAPKPPIAGLPHVLFVAVVEPNPVPPKVLVPAVVLPAGCPKIPVDAVLVPNPPPPNPVVPAAGCVAAPNAPVVPNPVAGFAPNAVEPPPKATTYVAK